MNLQGIKTRNLDQYKKIHQSKRYGVSAHRRSEIILPYFAELQPKAILDYGCGRSEIVTRLPGIKGFLFDPAIPDRDEIPGEFLDFPYEDRATLCSHVLEHLELDEIDKVLEQLKELAPNALIIVPTTTAREILPNGENAHATVRDVVWWTNKIREFFPLVSRVQGYKKEPMFVSWQRNPAGFVDRSPRFPDVRGKTVAVVGKATSLIGSGEGPKIDAADIVVRVNCELPIDSKLAGDIGSRTDAIFFNRSCSKAKETAERYNVPYTKYNKSFRNKLKDPEGYVPFTGTVAIFWFLAQGAKHVFATGMDFYVSGSVAGRGGHLKTKAGTGTHDPMKDRDRLKAVFESYPEKFSVGKALRESFEQEELSHYQGLKPDYSNYDPDGVVVPRRTRFVMRKPKPECVPAPRRFVAPRRPQPHIVWSRKASVSPRPEESSQDESASGLTGPPPENENAKRKTG